MTRPLVMGSRGSDLALWQSRHVAAQLKITTELRIITTRGDRVLDRDLSGMEGKGFFTKEIEEALLSREIDVAVHSLKDLPTQTPPGLSIAAVGERAPVADILLVHPDWHDASRPFPVKPGGRIGASSLRRQACVRSAFAEGEAASLRGNVPTRVRKCAEGQYAAIVLAEAGLSRLALDPGPLAVYRLSPDQWLPAPGQGALGIETRSEDPAEALVRTALDHAPTRRAVESERGLLAKFEGGCHLPLGTWARETPQGLVLRACFAPEPERLVSCEVTAATPGEAIERAHAELLRRAAVRETMTFDGATLCTRLHAWS